MRFNFANGWSVSILLHLTADPTIALCASTAAAPMGQWASPGLIERGPQEADADEAVAFLAAVAARPKP